MDTESLPKIELHQSALVGPESSPSEELLITSNFGGANRLATTIDQTHYHSEDNLSVKDIHLPDQYVQFKEKIKVDCVQCDNIVPLTNERVAIKIDIEGAETSALKGMNKLLTNNKCILLVETSEQTRSEVIEYLNQLGYQSYRSDDGGKNLLFQASDN